MPLPITLSSMNLIVLSGSSVRFAANEFLDLDGVKCSSLKLRLLVRLFFRNAMLLLF